MRWKKPQQRNVTAVVLLYYSTRALLFSPNEESCYVFWLETIDVNFLHLMVLFYKMIMNHSTLVSSCMIPDAQLLEKKIKITFMKYLS